jgi:hypothetical protein
MKKFSLALLAIATALAISPAALAQNYDFTYTSASPGVSASGSLTTGASVGGGYNVTNGGLTFESMNFDLIANANVGNPSYYPAPGVGLGSTGYNFEYDDILFPTAGPGGLLDNYGLLFYDASNGDAINIWSNGQGVADYTLLAYDASTGTWDISTSPSGTGTFTLNAVPDGGTTLTLLGLAIAGLAGLRRKLSM